MTDTDSFTLFNHPVFYLVVCTERVSADLCVDDDGDDDGMA